MADGTLRTQEKAGELKFFGINARYLIAQDATPEDLLADASCLGEGVDASLQVLIDGLSDDGSQTQANLKDAVSLLYAVMFQVQMMRNLAAGAESLLRKRD